MTTERLTSARLTYEDYCQLPNDGRQREIIAGIEYMAPAPNTFHQRLLGRLYVELSLFLRQHPIGEAFIAPYDVILSDHDVVQPDLLYVAQEHADRIKRHGLVGAPDLVVEVLSPSNRRHDEVQKRALYAQ
ncbi:MAG: Uma2 family endonuclease, partial [Bacteroidota bacterium]